MTREYCSGLPVTVCLHPRRAHRIRPMADGDDAFRNELDLLYLDVARNAVRRTKAALATAEADLEQAIRRRDRARENLDKAIDELRATFQRAVTPPTPDE